MTTAATGLVAAPATGAPRASGKPSPAGKPAATRGGAGVDGSPNDFETALERARQEGAGSSPATTGASSRAQGSGRTPERQPGQAEGAAGGPAGRSGGEEASDAGGETPALEGAVAGLAWSGVQALPVSGGPAPGMAFPGETAEGVAAGAGSGASGTGLVRGLALVSGAANVQAPGGQLAGTVPAGLTGTPTPIGSEGVAGAWGPEVPGSAVRGGEIPAVPVDGETPGSGLGAQGTGAYAVQEAIPAGARVPGAGQAQGTASRVLPAGIVTGGASGPYPAAAPGRGTGGMPEGGRMSETAPSGVAEPRLFRDLEKATARAAWGRKGGTEPASGPGQVLHPAGGTAAAGGDATSGPALDEGAPAAGSGEFPGPAGDVLPDGEGAPAVSGASETLYTLRPETLHRVSQDAAAAPGRAATGHPVAPSSDTEPAAVPGVGAQTAQATAPAQPGHPATGQGGPEAGREHGRRSGAAGDAPERPGTPVAPAGHGSGVLSDVAGERTTVLSPADPSSAPDSAPAPHRPAEGPAAARVVAERVARWIEQAGRPLDVRRVEVLSARLGPDGGDVRLQVYPPELGQIDLHLTTDNGRLTVHVVARHPETGQLLQQQAGALEEALQQAGLQLAGFSVEVGQHFSQASPGTWGADTPAVPAGWVLAEVSPDGHETAAAGRPAWVRLGMAAVDVRV